MVDLHTFIDYMVLEPSPPRQCIYNIYIYIWCGTSHKTIQQTRNWTWAWPQSPSSTFTCLGYLQQESGSMLTLAGTPSHPCCKCAGGDTHTWHSNWHRIVSSLQKCKNLQWTFANHFQESFCDFWFCEFATPFFSRFAVSSAMSSLSSFSTWQMVFALGIQPDLVIYSSSEKNCEESWLSDCAGFYMFLHTDSTNRYHAIVR